MLNNQDFAQSRIKSPDQLTSGQVLAFKGNLNVLASAVDQLPQAIKLLQETVQKIEGAYAYSTIRAYKADFGKFIEFCEKRNEGTLPALPLSIANFIIKLSNDKRSSAGIRRAICGISTIHKLNRMDDPTKDPDVIIEMRRMHRKLGRSAKQAGSINLDTLDQMLLATDDSIRGLRDKALLLVAYDTLCRRSELVSLQVKDVKITIKNGIESTSILLRKSKTDQDSMGKWLRLSKRAGIALTEWLKELPEGQEKIMVSINRAYVIGSAVGAGQINRIYKKIARAAGLDESVIKEISGHSMRVGAAQDLLSSGASMPTMMQRGRWSKSDTVMRYVEHI
jgi:site-specific recombinase XerD